MPLQIHYFSMFPTRQCGLYLTWGRLSFWVCDMQLYTNLFWNMQLFRNSWTYICGVSVNVPPCIRLSLRWKFSKNNRTIDKFVFKSRVHWTDYEWTLWAYKVDELVSKILRHLVLVFSFVLNVLFTKTTTNCTTVSLVRVQFRRLIARLHRAFSLVSIIKI